MVFKVKNKDGVFLNIYREFRSSGQRGELCHKVYVAYGTVPLKYRSGEYSIVECDPSPEDTVQIEKRANRIPHLWKFRIG